MTSLILATATRYLLPLLLLLSVYLLLRGHNLPGGGFVGGLAASAAFSLYAIADGVNATRRLLRLDPKLLVGLGLLTAFVSGCLSLFYGLPFMTGMWTHGREAIVEGIGTPLVFDVGVYMVVIGVVLTIIFALMEE